MRSVRRAERTASQQALRRLRASGIPVPEQPEFEAPRLPPDVTELDDRDLMALFGELTTWAEYLATQLAVAGVDERSAEESLKIAEARGAVRHKTEKTVAAVKALVLADPEVLAAREALDSAYAYRKILQPIADGAERRAAFVSRELTRRTGRADRENRNNRWNP